MRDADIDSALIMINREGWGYTRDELERMLLMDPEGSFLFEDDQLLGLITSVTYGHTGVIGHLVVSERARGKRIGQTLVKNAIDYCDGTGSESIILYATAEGLPVYKKFGFNEKRQVMLTKAALSESDHGSGHNQCTKMESNDLDGVFEMDERLFGDDRKKLLSLLFSQFPQHSWKLERGGHLVGFVMGRTTPSGYDVGPWECASDSQDAEILLRAVLKSFGTGGVYLGVFADNPEAVRLLSTLRPLTSWKTTFMVRGNDRYPRSADTYSMTSLELG